MLSVADIDRWDPQALREVFAGANEHAVIAANVADSLGQLPAFRDWGGLAEIAATEAIGQTRVDLNAHGQEAAAVALAADVAADGVEKVKSDLASLRAALDQVQLAIDPVTNAIVPAPGATVNPMAQLLAVSQYQPVLAAIIAEANGVDAQLAYAINMADGSMPIPMLPGGDPGSDQQIRDTVEEMLDGQDLDPGERQHLAEALTEQLRQSAAQGLTQDQAYAQAENFASTYMASNLHRSYVRKATRLQTYADALRDADGNLLSDVSDAVIPAARDANGELIWVDPATGRRVAPGEGITIPERGSFHLGHEERFENWRVLRQAAEENWTQKELNDFFNQRGRYRLEAPAENLSHLFEDKSPYVPNPEWTPPRIKEELAAAAAAGSGDGSATAPFIGAPPNIPNILEHPPLPAPQAGGSNLPIGPGVIPPAAPTPALPPFLTGQGASPSNPLGGPIGVSIEDLPPLPAGVPSLPSDGPLISLPPEVAEVGEGIAAGGVIVVATAAAVWALLTGNVPQGAG